MSVEADFKTHCETGTPSATGGFFMNRAPATVTDNYVTQRLIARTDAGLGTSRFRFQFDIFAVDPNGYGKVKAISEELTAAIRSFPGGDIFYTSRAMEMEMFDPDVNYYRVMLDAIVMYDEIKLFG